MPRVYYNKLIRDNIPDKIRGNGEECEVRPCVDDEEFQQELLKKVAEEASALSRVRTREEYVDECADLLAVLDALNDELGVSASDIAEAKEHNLKKKGGFTYRIFLRWSRACLKTPPTSLPSSFKPSSYLDTPQVFSPRRLESGAFRTCSVTIQKQ